MFITVDKGILLKQQTQILKLHTGSCYWRSSNPNLTLWKGIINCLLCIKQDFESCKKNILFKNEKYRLRNIRYIAQSHFPQHWSLDLNSSMSGAKEFFLLHLRVLSEAQEEENLTKPHGLLVADRIPTYTWKKSMAKDTHRGMVEKDSW